MPRHGRSKKTWVLLLACACHDERPSKVKGAPTTPPDESYQLGATGYEEGFIWTCNAGRRVHMARSCGELLGCSRWRFDDGPCGAPLASEPAPAAREPMTLGSWK